MRKTADNVRYELRTIEIETGIGYNQFFQNIHTLVFKVAIPVQPKISNRVRYQSPTTHKMSFAKSSKNKVKKFKQKFR